MQALMNSMRRTELSLTTPKLPAFQTGKARHRFGTQDSLAAISSWKPLHYFLAAKSGL